MYNSRTPDLYPHNAHHKLGWALAWLIFAHFIFEQFDKVSRPLRRVLASWIQARKRKGSSLSSSHLFDGQEIDTGLLQDDSKLSSDSRHVGEAHTVPSADSLRTSRPPPPIELRSSYQMALYNGSPHIWPDGSPGVPTHHGSRSFKVRRAFQMLHQQMWKPLRFVLFLVDRVLLILGFTAICTGIATFGRFFVSQSDSHNCSAMS